MVVTRAYIHNLREQAGMTINRDLESIILKEYCREPTPYTFSEQDLHEQIRKLVYHYNNKNRIPDPF